MQAGMQSADDVGIEKEELCMMKKMTKILLGMFVLLLALACTGCGNEEEAAEPVNIAFIAGIADNETRVNEGIEELEMLAAMPGTDYVFVSIDGTPSCIGDPGTIADLGDRGYTEQMMERVRAGIKADLTSRLANFEPDSDEIDMAGALQIGVRNLNAHRVEGRRNILVLYCSGRSTTGLINMVETPIYKLDVEASVPVIAERMNLDMSGIEVVFYCCGDVGDGQEPFSDAEKAKMKDFYQQLFLALGVERENIHFKDNLPSKETYQFETHPVTRIAVEEVVSGLQELVELAPEVFAEADTDVLKVPVVIPEEQVQYRPDSAEFLDPETAVKAIQPVAEFLTEHETVEILLYGTCAGDKNTENTLHLGKERAESVKRVLMEAGVEEERITAVSVRVEDDPYYQLGLGTGDAASVNRKTVMVDMSTELAKQILAGAED